MSVIEEHLVALWQSEEIFTGAVKEVKEETGVRNGIVLLMLRLKDCSDNCSSVNRLAFFMGLIMNMVPSMHLQIDTEFMELIAFR